jgi:hypothetical protein
MPLRLLAHRLLFCICFAIALFGARSAQAAAPICDERGASAIAPIPVLPIRDVRLDLASPAVCFELETYGPGFVPGDSSPAPTADGAPHEASTAQSLTNVIPAEEEGASPLLAVTFALPPGHRPCVFRPPRP